MAGSSWPCRAGVTNCAVRWKTVTDSACFASSGSTWTPDDPVPISPTRRPVRSTGSDGQADVEYCAPVKSSAPSNRGRFAADSAPVAVMT